LDERFPKSSPAGLLGPGDPWPAIVTNPGGASRFLLFGDHAGRLTPQSLGDLGLPPEAWERHIAWDIGVAGVGERLAAALDAPFIRQAYSRLVIDCNRAPRHPTSIPPVSELTPIPGNKGLSDEERTARKAAIFDPYHAAISQLLDQRKAAGRRTILVAMHSFTPVFKSVARKVEVGVLYHHETQLSRIMLDLLRAEGDLVVGANEPYAITDDSDYTVPVHGEGRGLDHVEIEIRQDLIAEALGQQAWAERMARLLRAADKQLRG
jgi:predicted N-formylglutamate amidohydrolase